MGTYCFYYLKEMALKKVRWGFFSLKKCNVHHGANGMANVSGGRWLNWGSGDHSLVLWPLGCVGTWDSELYHVYC